MRIAVALGLIVVLTGRVAPAAFRQDARTGRPPVVTERSSMLAHSPLAGCDDDARGRAPERSRIATWNIRAARSAPLHALTAELRAMQADVIALQEVDVRTRRGGFVDEPAALASALGFHYAFAASIKWDEGDYGLAVLSRWPLTDVRRHRLDTTEPGEPRIVLEVVVCASGRPLRVFNHHADRRAPARQAAFARLQEIVAARMGTGILVLGDLNEAPDAPNVRALTEAGLADLGARRNERTGGGGRIDYVLADAPLARRLSPAWVWPTDKSDHAAVLVDLQW